MKNSAMLFCSRVLIVTTLSLSLAMPNARAGIITSDQLIASQHVESGRDRLRTLVNRQDVREQLKARGADADAARARVDALSDDEIAAINGKLDTLPAGGDIVDAIVFVFIVLLVTDILGLTKVFPFTKPIRR